MASSSMQLPAAVGNETTDIPLQPVRRLTGQARDPARQQGGADGPGRQPTSKSGEQSTHGHTQLVSPAAKSSQTESFWSRNLFNVSLSLTRILAFLGFLLALIFGTGAWVGMDYVNRYARGSYQIAMYELCLSEVSLFWLYKLELILKD